MRKLEITQVSENMASSAGKQHIKNRAELMSRELSIASTKLLQNKLILMLKIPC